MKRRLHDTSSACRRHPKRMVIPATEQEALENVHEWDWETFLQEATSVQRIPRPLPSSMSSLGTSQGLGMPLLQHLRPQLKGYTQVETISNESIADKKEVVDAIDDVSSSTLTKGQHARYLQLESGSESWNEGRRKEFRKLTQRVQQEQELYKQALEGFWETHKDTFKVGLESNVARYCMEYAKAYQSAFRGPRYCGPCSQVISLQHVSKTAFTSARINSNNNLTLDSISSQVVHDDNAAKQTVVHDYETAVPVFDESKIPTLVLLQDDSLAMRLAKQYNASIVTTEETLQTLLQISGDDSTRWMIPAMKKHDGVIVLDVPVPRPTTPRECVTRGVTEGLYQSTSPDNDFTFTLLTLPAAKSSKSRRCKVLVRSQRRLYDAQQCPLHIHVQLEYFINRGWEESTTYERACWILDKLLCAHSLVARVDPATLQILKWEQVGVAHALAVPKNNPIQATVDPMNHLEALVQLLHATETLANGEHMLCLPPLSTSISVHKTVKNNEEDGNKMIDVMEELKKADAVYTGAAALRQCARVWRWKEDRIPFTFPIKEDEKTTSAKGRLSTR